MNWLRAIIGGLFDALLGWGQSQKEKPKTIKNANTPEDIKRDWDRYVADGLRDKSSGSGEQRD